MSKEKQIEIIEDLLIEFDEMGFAPTTLHPDPEAYATEWRRKMTEALKGYRKQSEWISVEERLPETEGDYLVWNKEQKKIEKRFFYRLPPHYPVESRPDIREYFGNFADYKRITHWMPLPEPPKKGGAE